MDGTPLARVRRICLALPGATEKIAWGAPTFRAGKGGKLFAMFADDHHGDGRIALWCHAPKGKQEVLVGAEPERYFRPPYVGPSGWIGLVLARLDDEELAAHVREAWEQVAPQPVKKKGTARRARKGGARTRRPARPKKR